MWSGREDLNLRPPAPEAGTLPDCATPRIGRQVLAWVSRVKPVFSLAEGLEWPPFDPRRRRLLSHSPIHEHPHW